MASLLKDRPEAVNLRWFLPALCLTLAWASAVRGQAVTRALPSPPQSPSDTVFVNDTLFVVDPDTVIVAERVVDFSPRGDTLAMEADTFVVEMGIKPDSTEQRASSPFIVMIRERPPPPTWPWWILLLLALLLLILLMVMTYMYWRARHYIPLLLKYIDQKAWLKVYKLVEEMPVSLARQPLVRQMHAFALNRDGRGPEAEGILRKLLEEKGPSAKTNGILGRVYKDRWEQARKANQTAYAADLLHQAVETYIEGHKAFPNHPYPSLNAQTLAEFIDPLPDWYEKLAEQAKGAAEHYRDSQDPYWDHASRLEVAVLGREEHDARTALFEMVGTARVPWQIETTLNNLRLIREVREARSEPLPGWVKTVETTLRDTMDSLPRKVRSRNLIALLRALFE